MRFEYIQIHAKEAETALYCRILGVTPQGYAKYVKNLTKPYKYAALLASIKAILAEDEFNKNYGKRRMFEKLQLDYDCPHSYSTVANVMRENGLLHKQGRPKGLTKADKEAQKPDNLLKRDFTAKAPNQKMVTDITEWAACDGKVYQSSVFDCFDNTCLGVSLSDNMRAGLCVETYMQAAGRYDLRGAVSHSDRGSQYTSEEFRRTPARFGITQSMDSAAGRCHDNAKCESMWARGKEEIMACYDTKKMTCEQLKLLIFRYYMGYWNNRRICSAIGGVPPAVRRGAYYEMLADHVA
ncbi:MAG: IS3 family transposase [Clostridiales Family XIII bacterium]|nr:IS3 family transposase [Clostridiales Family XIII bacterium]